MERMDEMEKSYNIYEKLGEEFFEMLKRNGVEITDELLLNLEKQDKEYMKNCKNYEKLKEELRECCYDYENFLEDYKLDICRLNDDDRFEFFKQMYTQSQFGSFEALKQLDKIGITKREMENINSHIVFDNNDRVKVYRGRNEFNDVDGRSWTTDIDVANRFAYETLGSTKGCVESKEVFRDEILFFNKYYINDIENEVMLKN